MKEKDNLVTNFLKERVQNFENHQLLDSLSGKIIFYEDGPKVDFYSKGAVYGIFIQLLEDQEINQFIDELKIYISSKLPHIKNDKTGEGNLNRHLEKLNQIDINQLYHLPDRWYILYWGKEAGLGTRIGAHCKTHKGTGSLSLNYMGILKKYKLEYGSISVTDYSKFEETLHKKFKSILG